MDVIEVVDSELENRISKNGKVGLVLLSTDQVTLYEFEKIFRVCSILLLPSRVILESAKLTPDVLMKIKDQLGFASNSILPDIDLDVISFSCTSASMVIGSDEIERIIKKSSRIRRVKAVTNPYLAIKNVCDFLSIKKIGLITPYTIEITKKIIDGLMPNIDTIKAYTFNSPSDNLVPSINFNSIKNTVMRMKDIKEIDSIFISCTNLNICSYIDELEKLSGKIILTSNQTMAWDILRLLNYKKTIAGFGSLLLKER